MAQLAAVYLLRGGFGVWQVGKMLFNYQESSIYPTTITYLPTP